jgi:hypothetical protein
MPLPRVRRSFDVTDADTRIQERYGRNSFGWSLLMAFPHTVMRVLRMHASPPQTLGVFCTQLKKR